MTRIHDAQLYIDSQDPANVGWWLRYTDEHGTEHGTAIDAAIDASVEDLASAVGDESHWISGDGEIKVLRGERPCGEITLIDGTVSGWRAY